MNTQISLSVSAIISDRKSIAFANAKVDLLKDSIAAHAPNRTLFASRRGSFEISTTRTSISFSISHFLKQGTPSLSSYSRSVI